jgi:flagellar biosynthetic protein FliR
VFDPTHNEQVSTIGQVYSITFVLLFLLAGGHRAMLAALLDTFRTIPLMSFHWDESLVVLLVEVLGSAMELGIRLAGPVLIALFLATTALGLLSRAIPQLHVLTVGFTIKVLVAVAFAGIALALCEEPLIDAVGDVVGWTRSTFGLTPSHVGLVH